MSDGAKIYVQQLILEFLDGSLLWCTYQKLKKGMMPSVYKQ